MHSCSKAFQVPALWPVKGRYNDMSSEYQIISVHVLTSVFSCYSHCGTVCSTAEAEEKGYPDDL